MRYLLPAAFATMPMTALAHPHIFIETAITVVVDDAGAVVGVEVQWLYDEFFSLLLVEDLQIDADGDLALNDAEEAILREAVLAWPAGFTGDTWVEGPDGSVELAARQDHDVSYVDGQVIESHFRPLEEPVSAAEAVTVQVYDPGYYTAYVMIWPAELRGPEGCEIWTDFADLDAAYSMLDELLYGRPASDVGPEEAFPEVGAAFADRVTVTCSVG